MRRDLQGDHHRATVRLDAPCWLCLASRWGRGPCTLVAPEALAAGTSLQGDQIHLWAGMSVCQHRVCLQLWTELWVEVEL